MKRLAPAVLGTVLALLLSGALPAAGRPQEPTSVATNADTPAPSSTENNRRRLEELTRNLAAPVPENGARSGEEVSATSPGSADPMLPRAPQPSALEGATKAKYEEALREYYDYHISGLRHRSKVFAWQLFSSRLIFVAVLLLVVTGIYFAAVQFHASLQRDPGEGDGGTDQASGETTTEFSASMEGIKVSSPLLGVVILVISLAFFYLYLIYVYPIENIF